MTTPEHAAPQGQSATLERELVETRGRIATLDGELSEAKGRIATLDEQLGEAMGRLASLQTELVQTGLEIQALRQALAGANLKTTAAEEALFDASERARMALASLEEGVIATDASGRVVVLNQEAERLSGWRSEEAVGLPLMIVFRARDSAWRNDISHFVQVCRRTGKTVTLPGGMLLSRRSGGELHIAGSLNPIRDRRGKHTGVVLVFRSASVQTEPGIAHEASHDPLTGLVNRREFERRLQLMLNHAKDQKQVHALCYLDLDQFKIVNDTCGHAAGDELLRQLVGLLRPYVRERDTFARLGGDEFGVLLGDCRLSQALVIANQLRKAVFEFRFAWQKRVFAVAASIGLVQITEHSGDLQSVLNAADAACFTAKESGGNSVRVYEPESGEVARRHAEMQWVPQLRQALDDDLFDLYWQPIVAINGDAAEKEGIAGEILLRLRADGGIKAASAFIPPAERYRLIVPIDKWVIRNALLTMRSLPGHARLSINISGQSVGSPEFLNFVIGELDRLGVRGDRICFEITETAAIANLRAATQFILRLRRKGCRFALDDVGSGLSSFPYLKNLPVHYLKIAGELVGDITRDPLNVAMVESIHLVGKALRIKTIAEGVEEQDALKKLEAMGVNYAQGWAIAKPEPLVNAMRRPASEPAVTATRSAARRSP